MREAYDWQLSQSTVDFRNEERRAANAGPADRPPRRYRVRQTDCRTGWQVIDAAGKVQMTTRRKETADMVCRDMNELPIGGN